MASKPKKPAAKKAKKPDDTALRAALDTALRNVRPEQLTAIRDAARGVDERIVALAEGVMALPCRVVRGYVLRPDADLNGAHLNGAHLNGADLTGADLTDAHLTGADLTGARLTGAHLNGADLNDARLTGADLNGAHLNGADVPVLPGIDAAILAAIQAPGHALEMARWHTCETTHCRAGWAVQLAGEAGKRLEEQIGANAAAALIYAASGSHPVPDWNASNEDAMADLRQRAGVAS